MENWLWSFCLFQIREESQRLHRASPGAETQQPQMKPRRRPQDRGRPSSASPMSGPVALSWTPTATFAPFYSRSEIWVWGTTPMRPSCSNSAVGHVLTPAPTTTWLWVTCCRVERCLWGLLLGGSGTSPRAAVPRTTRTWPSWTTLTDGTKWRSSRPLTAPVSDRDGLSGNTAKVTYFIFLRKLFSVDVNRALRSQFKVKVAQFYRDCMHPHFKFLHLWMNKTLKSKANRDKEMLAQSFDWL